MEKSTSVALARLEAKVHEASGELRRLAAENRELRSRLAEGGPPAGDVGWRQERDEIRERVARLAESLEGLLGQQG